jgi:hypothetical protein
MSAYKRWQLFDFSLTIGMPIVCPKNSERNPRRESELAINYPSPAGFAVGLGDRGGLRMIRDRRNELRMAVEQMRARDGFQDRGGEIVLWARRANDEL